MVYGLNTNSRYEQCVSTYTPDVLNPDMPVIYVQIKWDNKPVAESKQVVLIGLKHDMTDEEIEKDLGLNNLTAVVRWGRVVGDALPDTKAI